MRMRSTGRFEQRLAASWAEGNKSVVGRIRDLVAGGVHDEGALHEKGERQPVDDACSETRGRARVSVSRA
jgi:hypothetical protein